MKALILEEITTSELKKYIDNIKIAVVPTGSCEQHGPNTTFATDTVRAYEIAKLLGVKYGKDLLICPPIGYGISPHHMNFTETITLRIETYVSVMMDIAWSLKEHGIKKILFLKQIVLLKSFLLIVKSVLKLILKSMDRELNLNL